MKIGIGNDHAAVEMKFEIVKYLEESGYEVVNFGTDTNDSCDYPVYGEKVARAVANGEVDRGILLCGTGIGMSICANKVRGIRACCCSDTFSAEFTRRHNDANALCLGGRVVGEGLALSIVETFLSTPFEGGRHARRIDKMMAIETR